MITTTSTISNALLLAVVVVVVVAEAKALLCNKEPEFCFLFPAVTQSSIDHVR